MALRITDSREGGRCRARVDGDLLGKWVEVFQAFVADCDIDLSLDLSGVRHVDDQGVDAVVAALDSGATIEAVDPYLGLLLQRKRAVSGSEGA